jgi:signal transduction histidine kinase
MDRRRQGLVFVKRIRIMRSVGLGLSVLSVGSVLYQRDAPIIEWLLLLIWGYVWPQLGYFISSRSDHRYRAEQKNLLADAFFGGAWVPIIAFNVIPCLILNVFICMGILGAGGVWRLAKALVAMVLGGLAAIFVFGFEFQPISTTLNILSTVPMLLLYSTTFGLMAYDITKKLTLSTQELAEEVSQRVAAQEAAQQARLEAEAANRAKTDFLSHMSHELRTPLNAVIGFSEAMAAGVGGKLSEKHASYVDDISGSGQHLLSLINDILDLSKVEAGKAEIDEEEIDLREMVERSLPFVRERAQEAGIELSTDLPDRIPALRADSRKVKQMLVNLLSNAVKFTPSGGGVMVSVEEFNGTGLVLSVADTGAGMRPEDIPKALSAYAGEGHGGAAWW